MRITSKDGRYGYDKGIRGAGNDDTWQYRVYETRGNGRNPGRPNWKKIPSKRETALTDEEWKRRIEAQAVRDARFANPFSGDAENLMVEYLSRVAPDRRAMYEFFISRHGSHLDGYTAPSGANLQNVGGVWKCRLTAEEKREEKKFLAIYEPAYEAAKTGSRHIRTNI